MRRSFIAVIGLYVLLVIVLIIGAHDVSAKNVRKDYNDSVHKFINTNIRPLLQERLIIDAILQQNKEHESKTEDEIKRLDNIWRAETSTVDKPLINKVLGKEISVHLQTLKQKSKGVYTEIFIMDNKGLNVGQSDVTSDYWQGDEAKWQKTFLVGHDAVFVDDVEFDESTQTFQVQVNVSVSDPRTKKAIGAATFGIDAEQMEWVLGDSQ